MIPLPPDELRSLAAPIYGNHGWQVRLARDFGVAVRTSQRWAADGIANAETARRVRKFLQERARAQVEAPPADGYSDRDDDAYDEFRPRIEALVAAGVTAGWHPAEVLTAILAVTVDQMRENAGIPATLETVKQAMDSLRAARDT